MGKKYWINRFPVCAMVYREAAEMIGYDPEEAKSLGLGRAIFFAAAKSGFRGAGARKGYGAKDYARDKMKQKIALKGYDTDSVESLNFAGIAAYVIHTEDGSIRGFIGGEPIKPENYDKQVREKCILQGGRMGYLRLKIYVMKKLSELSKAELNSAAVYKLYESLRDDVRLNEFLEGKFDAGISAEANADSTKGPIPAAKMADSAEV